MSVQPNFLYYGSALLAIVGTIGYHNFIKKIPEAIDPIVSVVAIYVFVLLISATLFPFFVEKSDLNVQIRQINWTQFGVACAVVCMEIGFLLMYRNGWELSVGNLVTGIVINVALLTIGHMFLKEALSPVNIAGVFLSIVGVALIGYRA